MGIDKIITNDEAEKQSLAVGQAGKVDQKEVSAAAAVFAKQMSDYRDLHSSLVAQNAPSEEIQAKLAKLVKDQTDSYSTLTSSDKVRAHIVAINMSKENTTQTIKGLT